MKFRVAVFGSLLTISSTCFGATLTHQYQFNGNLSDDFAGPSLVSNGGTVNATNYSFAANQGLSLSNALVDPADYSIEIVFNFSELSSYRKIIDFKDRTVDAGMYNQDTRTRFYTQTTGELGEFTANVDARLVLTRDDATDLVSIYVDGSLKDSFTDSGSDAVFSAANNIIWFFQNDTVQSGEASPGVVDLIRIYDGDLTSGEVAALGGPSPVPEPSSLLLASCATSLFGLNWIRRRKTRTAA